MDITYLLIAIVALLSCLSGALIGYTVGRGID